MRGWKMVQIKLDSKYGIDSDRLQWILLKDGRPYWFFTDLESLLKAYVELKMRSSKAKSVELLLNYQEKIVTRLSHAINNISKEDLNLNLPIRKEVSK